MNTPRKNRWVPLAVGMGLCLALAWLPAQGRASDFGVYGGIALGDFHVGTDSWLRLGYARHSGNSAWGVSLGYNTPYYYHRAPRYAYYRYSPRYHARPYRDSFSVHYSQGRRDRWGVAYHRTWSPYSYHRYGYGYPASGHHRVYYDRYPRGYVSGVYRWDDDVDLAVGVAVPLVVSSEARPRPSLSERIVRGGPVERNPILKRVWVAGRYETVPGDSNQAESESESSRRVWVPGHWEYVPDTY